MERWKEWRTNTHKYLPPKLDPISLAHVCAMGSSSTRRRSCRQPRHRRPAGVLPVNLRRNADSICVLSKAQPRLAKQLIAGADHNLLNALSECASNILKGNLPLIPDQKRKLSRYANSLRALRQQKKATKSKKALLMKGGFVGALAGVLAPLLINSVPKLIGSVVNAIAARRRHNW